MSDIPCSSLSVLSTPLSSQLIYGLIFFSISAGISLQEVVGSDFETICDDDDASNAQIGRSARLSWPNKQRMQRKKMSHKD